MKVSKTMFALIGLAFLAVYLALLLYSFTASSMPGIVIAVIAGLIFSAAARSAEDLHE